ncbi:MAG: hypothetical protein ACR2LN_07515 [Candidatus Levyibacteriota bacterium]
MEHERPLHPPIEDLSTTGHDVFFTAAGKYPGSGNVQGAHIAHYCQETGANPLALGNAFLNDSELIAQIIARGNEAHEHRRKKKEEAVPKYRRTFHRLLADPRPPVINEEDARRTIEMTFSIADQMSVLELPELEEIIDMYPEVIANNGMGVDGERIGEGKLSDKIQVMIKNHTEAQV